MTFEEITLHMKVYDATRPGLGLGTVTAINSGNNRSRRIAVHVLFENMRWQSKQYNWMSVSDLIDQQTMEAFRKHKIVIPDADPEV